MWRELTLLPALALLAGCVNPGAARMVALNTAIGESEGELVRALGTPATVEVAGDRRMLTYPRTDPVVDPFRPDPSTVPVADAVGAAFDYPPEATLGRCATTFDVVAGRVLSWHVQGAAC